MEQNSIPAPLLTSPGVSSSACKAWSPGDRGNRVRERAEEMSFRTEWHKVIDKTFCLCICFSKKRRIASAICNICHSNRFAVFGLLCEKVKASNPDHTGNPPGMSSTVICFCCIMTNTTMATASSLYQYHKQITWPLYTVYSVLNGRLTKLARWAKWSIY